MATDWIVNWMMGPSGLLIIGMAAMLSAFIWTVILGEMSTSVGFRPLLIGYACGGLGLLISNFLLSHFEFSRRVSSGLLQETQRWSVVPDWTLYIFLLYLIFALPLATIVATPFSALLIRIGRLTYFNIAAAAVVLWLSLATLLWAFPTNEWHRAHRVSSLVTILWDFFPIVMLTTVPFLLGI